MPSGSVTAGLRVRPLLPGGYPMGTVFDVNNKGVELFVAVMHRLRTERSDRLQRSRLPRRAPARRRRLAHRSQLRPHAATGGCCYQLGAHLVGLRPGGEQDLADRRFASGLAMYGLPLSLSYLYRFLRREHVGVCAVSRIGSPSLDLSPLSFLFFYSPLAAYLLLSYRPRDSALWMVWAPGRCWSSWSTSRGSFGCCSSRATSAIRLPLDRRPQGAGWRHSRPQ